MPRDKPGIDYLYINRDKILVVMGNTVIKWLSNELLTVVKNGIITHMGAPRSFHDALILSNSFIYVEEHFELVQESIIKPIDELGFENVKVIVSFYSIIVTGEKKRNGNERIAFVEQEFDHNIIVGTTEDRITLTISIVFPLNHDRLEDISEKLIKELNSRVNKYWNQHQNKPQFT